MTCSHKHDTHLGGAEFGGEGLGTLSFSYPALDLGTCFCLSLGSPNPHLRCPGGCEFWPLSCGQPQGALSESHPPWPVPTPTEGTGSMVLSGSSSRVDGQGVSLQTSSPVRRRCLRNLPYPAVVGAFSQIRDLRVIFGASSVKPNILLATLSRICPPMTPLSALSFSTAGVQAFITRHTRHRSSSP